jgi:DHA1 family multidrug resistance protein-like MFS transporter
VIDSRVDKNVAPVEEPGKKPRSVPAIFAIALVAALAELAYAVMNVSAMPVYLRDSMRYGTGAVAGIGTAFLLCEGVAKGPFGMLGDRVGRKNLIIAGPIVSATTALLTLLVHPAQWYFFVLLRVLDGLGAAALWTSALAMIADVVPEDRRSQAMSLFNVSYMVGIALGPFIGGIANDMTDMVTGHLHIHDIDPRTASFYVVSILFILTALAAAWRVPNVRPHHEAHPHGTEEAFSLKALADNLRRMPQMMIMAMVTFLGIGLIMMIVKLFAMDEFKVSETRFGALLLVPCLIIGAASVPLGTLGDRIGRVRAIRLGIGLCALSMWSLIFMKSEWALVLGGSLIGVGFVISFPSWMAHISSTCDPRQRGAVMGAFGTAQGLGAMMGAPLGGYLYQHGHYRLPFVPHRIAESLTFLRVHGGHVVTKSHYVPFIGCALLLLVSWLIATFAVREEKGIRGADSPDPAPPPPSPAGPSANGKDGAR